MPSNLHTFSHRVTSPDTHTEATRPGLGCWSRPWADCWATCSRVSARAAAKACSSAVALSCWAALAWAAVSPSSTCAFSAAYDGCAASLSPGVLGCWSCGKCRKGHVCHVRLTSFMNVGPEMNGHARVCRSTSYCLICKYLLFPIAHILASHSPQKSNRPQKNNR